MTAHEHSIEEYDLLHAYVGLGAEWMASGRREETIREIAYVAELREAIALGYEWHGRDPHALLRDFEERGDMYVPPERP